MEAKQGLKVIDGGDSNDLEKQYPPFNNKQSGIRFRAALQVVAESQLTPGDIETMPIAEIIASQFPIYLRLNTEQKKRVNGWIEKFLCNCITHVETLPSEEVIIAYIENLCDEAKAVDPQKDADNTELSPVQDIWLATHFYITNSLSNIGIQDNK